MKIAVFGGTGRMGAAVAWDLVRQDDVERVGLVGRRADALERTRAWLESPKVVPHVLDVAKKADSMALMAQYDVCVSALPDRFSSYLAMHAAVEAGVHFVDMLEEYHRRPDRYELERLQLPDGMDLDAYGDWMHATALAKHVTVLDGIGFAPGLSNITVGEGIRRLDRAESAVARVGGIPNKAASANHPLSYMVTWSFSHVLREYVVKLNVRQAGQVVEVNALTDRERFRFDRLGRDEWLECAVTPGMPSFIFTRPELADFAEKTVRWPGHFGAIDTLKSCGLLDLEPLELDGTAVVPRSLLLAALEPRLRALPGESDACVMFNTVKGVKDGQPTEVTYHMWEEADPLSGISGMGRVTAFPAAIGAVLIGRGLITERGLVPPEDAITGETYREFLNELARRHITIEERVQPLPVEHDEHEAPVLRERP
ncbi:MAG: saccharopine dehydrogenase NADP-binding domain-containing protein [Vicinamibacteraceae bacterium]|nr:saccharopine dehydrogenase NADP-binding domain-containing protein [Vicinamibacteraceae bacterium]